MEDLAIDPAAGRLLTRALDTGRTLGVLCHAPAALLASRRDDGSWPFAGYRMTGFTDAEERLGGLAEKAPWLVQSRLVELGADFVEQTPFGAHIEVDRTLFTGQNPHRQSPSPPRSGTPSPKRRALRPHPLVCRPICLSRSLVRFARVSGHRWWRLWRCSTQS